MKMENACTYEIYATEIIGEDKLYYVKMKFENIRNRKKGTIRIGEKSNGISLQVWLQPRQDLKEKGYTSDFRSGKVYEGYDCKNINDIKEMAFTFFPNNELLDEVAKDYLNFEFQLKGA